MATVMVYAIVVYYGQSAIDREHHRLERGIATGTSVFRNDLLDGGGQR